LFLLDIKQTDSYIEDLTEIWDKTVSKNRIHKLKERLHQSKQIKRWWLYIAYVWNIVQDKPFIGQRQHSRLMSGVSQALQTQDVKSRTFFAP